MPGHWALKKPRVSVKATTEEGLGFTGSGEGISSQAITLLTTVDDYCYDREMMRKRLRRLFRLFEPADGRIRQTGQKQIKTGTY